MALFLGSEGPGALLQPATGCVEPGASEPAVDREIARDVYVARSHFRHRFRRNHGRILRYFPGIFNYFSYILMDFPCISHVLSCIFSCLQLRWHMILEDLREKYVPDGGKLRVIVITDGLDTHSPEPYRGMAGMHPMMTELLKDGYDIEWHIIVVALKACSPEISKLDANRYEALAELTGGGFLHLDEVGAMNDMSARHFLAALEAAVTGGDRLDSRALREQQGKAARFLSRLHESNRHVEDPLLDQERRRKQLLDYRSRSKEEVPWLPLLESRKSRVEGADRPSVGL